MNKFKSIMSSIVLLSLNTGDIYADNNQEMTITEGETVSSSSLKVMYVSSNSLTIRQGLSVGYSAIGYMHYGDKVEIVAKKMVGVK